MSIRKHLADEYKTHNDYLIESVKGKNKEISELKNRVEGLEEFAKMLIGEEELHQRGEYGTEFNRLFQLNIRYKQALEKIEDYDWDTHERVVNIARKALGGESE